MFVSTFSVFFVVFEDMIIYNTVFFSCVRVITCSMMLLCGQELSGPQGGVTRLSIESDASENITKWTKGICELALTSEVLINQLLVTILNNYHLCAQPIRLVDLM